MYLILLLSNTSIPAGANLLNSRLNPIGDNVPSPIRAIRMMKFPNFPPTNKASVVPSEPRNHLFVEWPIAIAIAIAIAIILLTSLSLVSCMLTRG